MNVLPTIVINRVDYRGYFQWKITCPYDPQIKSHLQKFEGVRWSKQLSAYYMFGTNANRDALVAHCKHVASIEVGTNFSGENESQPLGQSIKETKLPPREYYSVHPDVLEKIASMKHWMEQKRYSTSTVKTYVSMVKQFFALHESVKWNDIPLTTIESYCYKEFIERQKSYSAQNQFISAIKIYFRTNHFTALEIDAIERPKKSTYLPNVLTKEEVRLVILSTSNIKHRTLLTIIYGAGLRIGEALKLRITDVRSEEGLLYIRGSKGKKDRRVPLSDTMLRMLREYYIAYRPKTYVFEGASGGLYSPSSAQKVLKRAVKQAGITIRVTLHTLRHSYATHLLESGVGLRYIQEILGHNNPKTTMIYTHVSGKKINEVRSPLEDLGF